MIIEISMATQERSLKWWLDYGATVHVSMIIINSKTYEDVNNYEVFMGNDNSTKVCS